MISAKHLRIFVRVQAIICLLLCLYYLILSLTNKLEATPLMVFQVFAFALTILAIFVFASRKLKDKVVLLVMNLICLFVLIRSFYVSMEF